MDSRKRRWRTGPWPYIHRIDVVRDHHLMPKTMHCQDLDKIGIFRCVEWIPGFGSLSIYWEFHIDQPPPMRYLVFHLDAITYSTIVVLCTFSPDDPIPRVVFGRVPLHRRATTRPCNSHSTCAGPPSRRNYNMSFHLGGARTSSHPWSLRDGCDTGN